MEGNLNQFEEAAIAATLLAEDSLAALILKLETETGIDTLDEDVILEVVN